MSKQSVIVTTTHVAGCPVGIGKRIIQRCLVCGEKLADTIDQDRRKVWNEGEMVVAEFGFFRSAGVDFQSLKNFPRDFCIELVER